MLAQQTGSQVAIRFRKRAPGQREASRPLLLQVGRIRKPGAGHRRRTPNLARVSPPSQATPRVRRLRGPRLLMVEVELEPRGQAVSVERPDRPGADIHLD